MTSRSCFGTTSLFGAVALAALFLFAHDARAQKVDDGAEYLEDSSAAAPDDGFRPVWQQQQQARKATTKHVVQRGKAKPDAKKQQVADNQPSAPMRTETTVYDRWTVTCHEVVGTDSKKTCSAALRITNNEQKLVILLEIARAKDGKIHAIMQTPTGVMVQKGVDLVIGDAPVGKLDYAACVPENCEATGALEEPSMKKIEAASTMVITIHAKDGRDVHFKFPLAGIDKAVAAVRS